MHIRYVDHSSIWVSSPPTYLGIGSAVEQTRLKFVCHVASVEAFVSPLNLWEKLDGEKLFENVMDGCCPHPYMYIGDCLSQAHTGRGLVLCGVWRLSQALPNGIVLGEMLQRPDTVPNCPVAITMLNIMKSKALLRTRVDCMRQCRETQWSIMVLSKCPKKDCVLGSGTTQAMRY